MAAYKNNVKGRHLVGAFTTTSKSTLTRRRPQVPTNEGELHHSIRGHQECGSVREFGWGETKGRLSRPVPCAMT
jgi:hypothetical protein